MSKIFFVPNKILSGEGAVKDIGQYLSGKVKKALLVTDKFMVQFGNAKKVTDALDACSIDYILYDGVNGEPTESMVEKGVSLYKENNCDFLIGLGGGSPMDTAKAIGFMSVSKGQLSDYMHKSIDTPVPYLVAIPTTAGTGSEATQFTIITDTKNNVKMLLAGPSILPQLAIIDPDFTLTAPAKVTVATGIDALCHAVEAYTSRKAQPLSDIFALSAIKRIHKNLPLCFADGKNVEARMQMSLAATEAGISFNNSSVTIVHGMSRPIGALFHIAHGVSNAVLLVACMEFAVKENTARFAQIARLMEVAGESTPDHEAAESLVKELSRFCKALEVPTLAELNVNKEDFMEQLEKMAADALDSGSPANTMRQPAKEDIIAIYKKLF
ncbi:iron-containing alcohol dehydrogenase [Pectinatus haikarae]|uniref:1,3-propanediol dehydrogenase n=1 Tax=Pectinatus haikarae TaxID=349096 RepID=A0ABT9YAM0_9FIRM|nr:iron-containing alcohol dehydrogenase [Pectinatus haikarae]MDQ0204149.1 1,3-propanediol dehydrogenase [Pectinatus haikarae]